MKFNIFFLFLILETIIQAVLFYKFDYYSTASHVVGAIFITGWILLNEIRDIKRKII